MPATLLRSPRADARIARASAWLDARPAGEEVLVVAATADAANDLLRSIAARRGAAFGWHRKTLIQLAVELATPALAAAGLAPLGALAREAVAARALERLRARGELGRLAGVADAPGLARAVTGVLAELRDAGLAPRDVAGVSAELVAIAEAVEAELAGDKLVDRAAVVRLATARARDAAAHPLLGLPTLLLDLEVDGAALRDLVAAIAARAPEVMATLPSGDEPSARELAAALGVEPAAIETGDGGTLARLQAHLFEPATPPLRDADDRVVVLSAPGESRECVEIARRSLDLAADGVPFDRMAVLLRSPEEYRAYLEEAFARAEIPAHFARGAVAPDPAGRAFAALLGCASEGLAARRFAEYLSLGEVPPATPDGAPPPPIERAERWIPPDEELVLDAMADGFAEMDLVDPAEHEARFPRSEPQASDESQSLRAPRRWERLLVDAAVIGGLDRWERRLDGLARSLDLDLASFDDPAGPEPQRLLRDQRDLEALRAFALPLVGELDALPERASFRVWIDALTALATRALRKPERVLTVLAELEPMANVEGVTLDLVRAVLEPRLLQVSVAPEKSRYGRVYVAPALAARGLAFDVVFVPGLAERLFPRKIAEEPILLDASRAELGAGLVTNAARVARERLALRLAIGAARERVVLSYPRLDLDEARPRVPSFYALEALRAAEGVLPGFDQLAKRAETLSEARVGWPAPRRPEDAIDAAEHDLALLESLLRADPEQSRGTARYLLGANPHLARALRSRARRWYGRWTWADGLVEPHGEPVQEPAFALARAAMAKHALAARSYSPTALQHFAACPYRFFLQAIHRLAPREIPEAIEEMDPLQRGSLVHEVQFGLFQRLADEKLLPVTPENLALARDRLDATLDAAAARARDEWAPAIERVWQDGIDAIRADLREWLRRMTEDESGFVPWKFELAFGLHGRRDADPDSTPEPVALDAGIQLRGSIDLVERRADASLRATDHKTGKQSVPRDTVVKGGEALQPVLYALALEKRFPDARVESGRLYYCTSAGGFAERVVTLDANARHAAGVLAGALGESLAKPFLPAAPAQGACRWCDYRSVCGPYEELRTSKKPREELAALESVRELR
jgi:RecB family exonuclease